MNKETESSKAICRLEKVMAIVGHRGNPSPADIEFFCSWTSKHRDLIKQQPLFSKLATLTKIFSAENDITSKSHKELCQKLCRICRDLTGGQTNVPSRPNNIYDIRDEGVKIKFPEKTFYFSGQTRAQNIKYLHKMVDSRGGLVLKKLARYLDYLVIGDKTSSNQRQATDNDNVAAVWPWIKEGHGIKIIHEEHFRRAANKEIEPQTSNKQRSIRLLVDFDENILAPGWTFAVKDSFKRSLDIHLTKRIKYGKHYWLWTQGTNFKFKTGYTIYNSPEGWPHPNVSFWVQITEASDVVPETKLSAGHPGLVIFDLYFRHIDGSALKDDKPRICSQVEFVQFLQTGVLHGERIT